MHNEIEPAQYQCIFRQFFFVSLVTCKGIVGDWKKQRIHMMDSPKYGEWAIRN